MIELRGTRCKLPQNETLPNENFPNTNAYSNYLTRGVHPTLLC